jgi:hypothetical protein
MMQYYSNGRIIRGHLFPSETVTFTGTGVAGEGPGNNSG